jgi:hypothetical protein
MNIELTAAEIGAIMYAIRSFFIALLAQDDFALAAGVVEHYRKLIDNTHGADEVYKGIILKLRPSWKIEDKND